jgi:hypothetical protein
MTLTEETSSLLELALIPQDLDGARIVASEALSQMIVLLRLLL